MQYLIHDLLKLSLEERLTVVEKLICSIRSEQEPGQAVQAIRSFTRGVIPVPYGHARTLTELQIPMSKQ